jgi:L-lactate dehydrogenase (cytochrome)
MLGTHRRTFRNLVGHVDNLVDLSSLSAWTGSQFDPTLSWNDIGWVKDRFGGKVIVKGVLDADDARSAVANGADGIIVSNHGGRQLDGAPSSIRVLPEIVAAVGGKTEIYLDGGIRSGQDVIKALALGAKSTFIGRPFLYGLGAGGEAGVTRALEIIQKEMDITMALCGERDIKNIGAHTVYKNGLMG